MAYSSFLISDLRKGQQQDVEPWLLPEQAFETMDNCYLHRGVIKKRKGYSKFGRFAEWSASISSPGVTKAALGNVTTAAAHGLTTGDVIRITGVSGMTELNGNEYTITLVDTTNFTLGVDTSGYTPWTSGGVIWVYTSDSIMGIMRFVDSTGVEQLIAANEDRLCTWDGTNLWFEPITAFSEQLDVGEGSKSSNITAVTKAALGNVTTSAAHGLTTGDLVKITDVSGMTELNGNVYTATVVDTINFTLGVDTSGAGYTAYTSGGTIWIDMIATGYVGTLVDKPILAGSMTVTDGTETFSDNGAGVLTGDATGSGTINYTTGAWALTFNARVTPEAAITSTYTCYTDIFTGDEADFFYWTNYDDKLWFTNGVNRIKTWDGSVIDSPIIDVANKPADPVSGTLVQTCKQIFNLKERLILFRTKEAGTWHPQRIRWSQAANTAVWRDSVAGEGDYLDVSAGGYLQGGNYLKDNLVVLLDRSVWLLRWTGDPNLAFRIDKLNSLERTDCPGAILSFDDFVVGVGVNGIFACDGNTTKQIDEKIPDFTLGIDKDYIEKSFGKIIDEKEQMWITYVKYDEAVDATKATNVLVWNYKDNAWSTYDIPLSCIGEHFLNGDKRLNQFGNDTLDMHEDSRLNSFIWQSKHPIILGGAHDGYVWRMSDGNSDNTAAIAFELVSARWNPFNQQGKDTRLKQIDFYANTDGDDEITVDFYVNEDSDSYQSSTLDFTGIGDKSWHTIHSGAIGNTHRIKITDSSAVEYVEIHGIRLWVEPTGRGIL